MQAEIKKLQKQLKKQAKAHKRDKRALADATLNAEALFVDFTEANHDANRFAAELEAEIRSSTIYEAKIHKLMLSILKRSSNLQGAEQYIRVELENTQSKKRIIELKDGQRNIKKKRRRLTLDIADNILPVFGKTVVDDALNFLMNPIP